ncbi:MAG: DUF1599 domain-containing protein [Bacteroidota bacterium]
MNQTSIQYDQAINKCREIFIKKNNDYGTSWRVMRLSSITDQIFIKAQRLKTIELKGEQKIGDDEISEYIGIINYCLIGLIQMELKESTEMDLNIKELSVLYDQYIVSTKKLMEEKNHDYGEAWRDMRVSTFTDMILMRLLRIKQIEDSKGKTIMSEGVDANLQDMINYSVFALIQLDEQKNSKK